MADPLNRRIHILLNLQNSKYGLTIQTLSNKLSDEGFEVTCRMLQRDLKALSETFISISCEGDKKGQAYRWVWKSEKPCFTHRPVPSRSLPEKDKVSRHPSKTLESI